MAEEVLGAVQRLLTDSRFHDVEFVCADGHVSANRALLAARCEYSDKMLFAGLAEPGATGTRLQAHVAAVAALLHHMHTGQLTFGASGCGVAGSTLLEAASLAQGYLLPGVVRHVAERVASDLGPDDYGVALSFALQVRQQRGGGRGGDRGRPFGVWRCA